MHPVNRTARIAGILYLSLLPLGIFGLLYVSASVIVPGDAAATAANIIASESLFRTSIVTALLVQIVNVFVVIALYQLLSPVDQTMARLMAVFILLGAPIAMLSEAGKFAVLYLLNNADIAAAFTADQIQALMTVLLEWHERGIGIASIFWGLWLFPMGYLVFKSGFLPRFIGVLLMIGCFGYLFDFATAAFYPDLGMTISQFTFIGEIALPLWLLIKGVDGKAWEKLARQGESS
jgi:hypothetical protein